MSLFNHPQMESNESFARVGKDEYITFKESVFEWTQGDVRFRVIVPAGLNTDFMSNPTVSMPLGFKKDDPRTIKASQTHDFICYHISNSNGVLPEGSYQFWNPTTKQWENCKNAKWNFKQADALFKRQLIEDGFPPKKATVAYYALRWFGWAYRLSKR